MDPIYAYSDGHEVRRENPVITVQVSDHHHRRAQQTGHGQRFSPHENHQASGTRNDNGTTRYQASPVLPTTEDYDASAIVTQSGPTVHLESSAPPYSPPIDGIRGGQQPQQQQQPQTQQQLVATSYADANAVIKYDAESAVAAESIKASNTYTTLETVIPASSQTVQYQYLPGNESFQQASSTYSYTKPGDSVILTYPPGTQLTSRPAEVSSANRFSSNSCVSRVTLDRLVEAALFTHLLPPNVSRFVLSVK